MMKTKNENEKLHHLKIRLFAIMFALLTAITAYGQERTLTGVVSDNKGEPLPGVSVVIPGSTTGVVTDINGKFSIKASNDNILRFSFVGYTAQEIKVNDQTSINVTLNEDVKELNEVVVIGYGVQKKSDLTGSVASVSAKDLQALPATRVDEALEGRAAGVNIISNSGMPGGTSTIQIRGISSINGSNPLVVIDGIPTSDVNAMNRINPSDIENVEVFKDAASSAIYGSNGGNGVISITTKKGQVGKTKTTVNYFTGMQQVASEIKLMNSTQWNNLYAEMNKGVPFTMNADTLSRNFDWQKALFKTARMQNIDANVTGGSEKSRFSIGLSDLKQDGIIGNTAYEKLLLSIGSIHDVTKHIKLDEIVRFSNEKTTGPAEWQYQNVYNNYTTLPALMMVPFQTPYDATGKWTVPFAGVGAANPFTGVDEKSDQYTKNMGITGNFGVNIELIKGLTYTSRINGSAGIYESWQFSPIYYSWANDNNLTNKLTQNIDRSFSWTFQNYLTYNKSILDEHNISIMAGMEAADWWDYNIGGYRQDFTSNATNLLYFDNSTNSNAPGQKIGGSAKEATSQAYFGRLNYDFKSMLLLQLNARRDGESNFGPNFKWGNFYSWSVGFKFTELQAVKDLNIFSFGKVRVGWGQTGQFPIKTYWPYASTILSPDIMAYSFNNKTLVQGAGPVQVPNPDLHWETVDQTNVGIDLGFLKDQLTVSIDYFDKTNDGMIMAKQVNATGGVYMYAPGNGIEVGNTGITTTLPSVNFGNVSNKGVELTLNYKKQFGDLKTNIGLNFTYQKNKITALATDSVVQGAVANEIQGVTVSKVGYAIGEFLGYKTDGIFRATDRMVYNNKAKKYVFADQPFTVNATGDTTYAFPNAKPGDARFSDLNHNGVVDPRDETYLGSYIPPYVFGCSLGFEYKGIDFAAFFQGVYGNKIFNGVKRYTHFWQGTSNRGADFADRYHLPIVYKGVTLDQGNTSSDMPDWGGQNWGKPSVYYLEDGSYLRFKSLTIGYTLPNNLTRIVSIEKLRVYFTAKNLFTLTKYTGYDPEVGNIQGDPTQQGIDISGYPQTRMYTFGVNLEF